MIRKCGILRKDKVGEIGRAFTFYKNADIKPDRPEAAQFRRQYSRDEQMSDAARIKRAARGTPESQGAPPFSIKYLGVWDTVGALGIPDYLRLSDLFNSAEKYRFHDPELSSIVEYARHAVALDEDRKAFRASVWENLDRLNGLPGRKGHYEQRWFPGDHGSVGGGGDVRGLSNDALGWILEGAANAGLQLNSTALESYLASRDFLAPLRNVSARPGWWSQAKNAILYPREPRTGPASQGELSQSALNRLSYEVKSADGKPYRPASLSNLLKEMFPGK